MYASFSTSCYRGRPVSCHFLLHVIRAALYRGSLNMTFSLGGRGVKCIILNHKNYLAKGCEKSLTLFQGQILGGKLSLVRPGEISNLCFWKIFYFWVAFFQLVEFCVGEILNICFGANFFSYKGIFKIYKGAFFRLRVFFCWGV